MPEYIDDKTQVDRKLADAVYQAAEQYVNTGKYDEAGEAYTVLDFYNLTSEENIMWLRNVLCR